MRLKSLVLSLTHIFLLILLICSSIFFVCFSLFDTFNDNIIYLFQNNREKFLYLGSMIFFIFIFFLIGFIRVHKIIYYQVKMGPLAYSVHPSIIQSYIEKHWKKNILDYRIVTNVNINKNQVLEIDLHLPITKQDEDVFLEKTEKEIGKLLLDNLKYDKNFILTVHYS